MTMTEPQDRIDPFMVGNRSPLLDEGLMGAAGGNWCFGSLQVCAYRVTQLNSNGTAWAGAGHGLANNALIDATISPVYSDGADLEQKNGCGSICQSYKDCDRLKAFNVTLNLCALDGQLMNFMMGGTLIRDTGGAGSGDVIGYEYPSPTDNCTAGVALELWSKAWDGSAQAAPAFAGGSVVYFHWVFPKTTWRQGDITLEDGFSVIPMTGYSVPNSRISANGPYDDWPADVALQGGIMTAGGWFFDTTLPTASCAAITVSSAAS